MQTQSYPSQFKLFVPANHQLEGPTRAPKKVAAPCSTTKKFLKHFELITGWKAEFRESAASLKLRSRPEMEEVPAQGTFSIVDMSAHWPANKLTCHRGECDELVELFSTLVSQLQSTKLDLSRARACLTGLAPAEQIEESTILVDSFVPKFDQIELEEAGHQSRPLADDDSFVLDQSNVKQPSSDDTDFEVNQHLDSQQNTLVALPFSGWSLAGNTGIVAEDYLDWFIDHEENVEITVGRIESAYGHGDSAFILKVDPLTSEYRCVRSGSCASTPEEAKSNNEFQDDINSQVEISKTSGNEEPEPQSCNTGPTFDNKLNGFIHWDSAVGKFLPLTVNESWTRLKVGDAIIGCTDNSIDLNSLSAKLQAQAETNKANSTAKATSANELAELLKNSISHDNRALVLKRD